LRALRTDNGGEYISKEFTKYCRDRRIRRELTIARTPQQNGVAERNWRTLYDMSRSLLRQNNMEQKWWDRALVTAAYIRNRCLTNGLKGNQTSYEVFLGERPDVSNLRIFGSKVITLNDDPSKGKLDNRGIEGIFVGYRDQKSYLIYLPSKKRVIASRNVRFFEKAHKDELEEVQVPINRPKRESIIIRSQRTQYERVKNSNIEVLESDDDEEDLRPTNKLLSPQKTSSPQKKKASRNSPQKASSQEPTLRRSQRERRPSSDF
jgi:hypothetical protein